MVARSPSRWTATPPFGVSATSRPACRREGVSADDPGHRRRTFPTSSEGRTILKLTGSTSLITGGATGIGFALARRLSENGNRVIICGRNEAALRKAQGKPHDGFTGRVRRGSACASGSGQGRSSYRHLGPDAPAGRSAVRADEQPLLSHRMDCRGASRQSPPQLLPRSIASAVPDERSRGRMRLAGLSDPDRDAGRPARPPGAPSMLAVSGRVPAVVEPCRSDRYGTG